MTAKKAEPRPKAEPEPKSRKSPRSSTTTETSRPSKASPPRKLAEAKRVKSPAKTEASTKIKGSTKPQASSKAKPSPGPRKAEPEAERAGLDALAERHRASFEAAQAVLTARYGIGRRGGVWAYDQKTRELRFSAEGTVVVARASLLGSWSNESWLWAWANDSIVKPVAEASRKLRDAAAPLGIPELTSPMYFASAAVVERVAVAAFGILGAKGCYFPSTATGKLVFVIHTLREPVPAA